MVTNEKIIQLIAEATKIDPAKIKADSHFIDDLNLDSLDMVELMMKMEDEFDIEIAESDTDSLKTVSDVVNYINTKQS